MSLLDSLFGVLVAIPPAWFSAHNVTPGRRSAYPIGRSLIVGRRAIHVAFAGIRFRAATVVGFFGGGGMGLYLKRTVQSLETQRVAAILLTIIALVTVAELGSGWLRSRVRDWR